MSDRKLSCPPSVAPRGSSADYSRVQKFPQFASRAGAVDPGHLRRLIEVLGGMVRSKRSAGAVAGLPDDPLVEILSRVPAKSVCRFRCVSKAWRDLIDDPLNRMKLPQTLEGFFVVHQPRLSAAGGGSGVGYFDFINFLARSVPLDIDRLFSFLTKLPENERLSYKDSCNGLILLEPCQVDILGGYVVCNPATKHWVTVPPCGCCQPTAYLDRTTFLAFDSAVSSHFHLIQFWFEYNVIAVHAYSSETGMWSRWDEHGELEEWPHQGKPCVCHQRAFVNGILHLIATDFSQSQMVAVDVQGKTKRMITMPAVAEGRRWCSIPYIGQSQGRLHYINHDLDAHDTIWMQSSELSIWELKDYDTQEWVLKDTVSFLKLFGIMKASRNDFVIVAIHPDCNVVFFQLPFKRLIAYDMDRKEVSDVACLEHKGYVEIAPYIPYFSKSPALTDKN